MVHYSNGLRHVRKGRRRQEEGGKLKNRTTLNEILVLSPFSSFFVLSLYYHALAQAKHGSNVIAAIKACSPQVQHVVYNSVAMANEASKKISHFWSKADVEDEMKKEFAGKFNIVRPGA
jgi:hypothetical protein